MAIVKSKLLKQLSQNYPNFLRKDLEKFTDIILKEIKRTLRRGERVELRGFGVFSTNTQKARISRNPKTGEKVHTPAKKTIHFKMAKDLFKKINDLRKYFSSINKDEVYSETLDNLLDARKVINDFFDNVIVNDIDPGIRKNRLELIQILCKTFNNYVNFSLLDSQK